MIAEKLYAMGVPLANHLWQSTLFAAMVWLLTLSLHDNQARVRYRLVLAACLKFLLPFSLLVFAGRHLAKAHGGTQEHKIFYFVVQQVSQPFYQGSLLGGRWITFLPQVLAAIWLAGSATVLFRWWLQWRRVAATIHAAIAVSDGREWNALRRQEGMAPSARPISLRLSWSATEPSVFGIRRPVLLWPAGVSDRLEEPHMEAILAHEVEHVRRQDNLAATLHMLVEVCVSGFTRWSGGWERNSSKSASWPAMRKCCAWVMRRQSMPKAF